MSVGVVLMSRWICHKIKENNCATKLCWIVIILLMGDKNDLDGPSNAYEDISVVN